MTKLHILWTLLVLIVNPLQAADPHDLVGRWRTPEGISVVRIEYVHGRLQGIIHWIHPDAYVNGQVPRDVHNSDPAMRSRKLEGLKILSGFTYDEKKERWNISKIYDPERGRYFEGHITLNGPAELSLRGYFPGKKWLGQTEVWTRE